MPALTYVIIAISFLLLMTITDFEQQVILDEMIVAFALLGLCYVFYLQLPLQIICLHPLAADCFFCFWHLSAKVLLAAVILN